MLNFFKLLLVLISFKNIIFSKLKKIHTANYFIISRDHTIIDKRTLYYFKKKEFNKTFNLIRTSEINTKIFFKIIKIPNIFCYSLIKNLISKKTNSQHFVKLLTVIFKFIGIKYLYMIDDRREIKLFSRIAKINNIKNLIYMHGRFSHKLNLLSKLNFSKYLVWSNFFKNELLKSNKKYNSKNVIVVGNPFINNNFIRQTIDKNFKIKKCLILDEDFIRYSNVSGFFDILSKHKKIKFFLKKKITRELPAEIHQFCIDNNFRILSGQESLSKIIKKFKIDSILASTSTGLLEACYYQVVPLKFDSKNYTREKEFNIFVKERLVYNAINKKTLSNLLVRSYSIKELNLKRKKLWGEIKFKYNNVQKILNSFPNL